MTPKFSIIIPVYNASKYIKDTLNSIFNQTYKNFEVFCVDDGSSDNSLEILNNIAKTESRLNVITQQNSGAGVARNNGISKARGEYVMFIDSDDLFATNNVLDNLSHMTTLEDCDLYLFGFNKFNDGSTELSEYKIASFDYRKDIEITACNGDKIQYFTQTYSNESKLFIHNWIAPWNKVYRREFLIKIKAKFDTIRSVEDRTFHFQTVTKSKKTMLIDMPVINYRLNVAGSLTNNFNAKKLMNHISAYQSIVDNTNMYSCEEKQAFFKSTVTDVYTFYLRSIESEKQQVFLKMKEFFHDIYDTFKDYSNEYEQFSIFYDITRGLSFPYGEENKKLVPIVFATNENYAPYAGVAIQSMIENCDKNVNYQVYVFYTKLSKNTIHRLEGLSTDNVHVQAVNITSYVKEQVTSLYQQDYYSVEMYYRMLIAKILPMFDKVVYLDCDIVVLDDVQKLYDITNFENNELLAGGLDMNLDEKALNYIKGLGIKDSTKYINSGILVLNTDLIRKEDTFGGINEFLNAHQKLMFPDQDAINCICEGRIFYFDSYWNYQWSYTFGKYYTGLLDMPLGVLHFTTKVKPWKNPTMPLSEKFWQYAKHTPFYEQILFKMEK